MGVEVNSEINHLKKVLLHRPGRELENLIPDDLQRLLFDDIPDLEVAIKEHDHFANVLRDLKVEVVYLEHLMAEVLTNNETKELFIWQFIEEAQLSTDELNLEVYRFLKAICSNESLIEQTMAGITTDELFNHQMINEKQSPFIIDPMPNLYFTRDPFTIIGGCISRNNMAFPIRNREAIYADFIFKYHPMYQDTPSVYHRHFASSLEGGDLLNLSESTLLIGISQRTQIEAIKVLATQLFFQTEESPIDTILAIKIQNKRAYMHLDTLLTQVHQNQFVIHPDIMGSIDIIEIKKGPHQTLSMMWRYDTLAKLLTKYLREPVDFILCGGGDYITSHREQWSDGANTLCIKPGEVIVYARNHVTNEQLIRHGIKIHEIPCSELSRGRGGPRCMSMPLLRER